MILSVFKKIFHTESLFPLLFKILTISSALNGTEAEQTLYKKAFPKPKTNRNVCAHVFLLHSPVYPSHAIPSSFLIHMTSPTPTHTLILPGVVWVIMGLEL